MVAGVVKYLIREGYSSNLSLKMWKVLIIKLDNYQYHVCRKTQSAKTCEGNSLCDSGYELLFLFLVQE